ncbi:MAG: hypothetical protein ACLU9S_10780 [Oscillospiraceae bacterium]
MAWAVCSGLIRGVNASNEAPRLDPKATSNRAQVATLMHRLDVILDGGSLCRSSQRIIDFIKAKEGFSATPYWDYSQYTIGYGTCLRLHQRGSTCLLLERHYPGRGGGPAPEGHCRRL